MDLSMEENRKIEQLPGRNEEQSAGLKKTMYVLAAVAAVLLVALAAVWMERSSLVKELKIEKEDLTKEMIALQNDYASLSSDYESINMQLDSSREEVSQLIERIKRTEATNRTKIRQYEKELGTLRSIMRNYIVQIDSLNTLNQKLTADAAAARREAAESRRQNEELNRTVKDLSGQVAAGAVLKGRGLRLDAYNASNRKHPDGALLTNASSKEFLLDGQPMMASASREVDYQGSEVELSIYLNDIPDYVKGIYTVEAFTEKGSLGTAELMLR